MRIPARTHGIDRKKISANALDVIKQLTANGHQAYLVGGSVRDLLLNSAPKDFDVSTSAKPEQILKIFRKARIIGRRFRIVHVYFGREVIEVTTFRGTHQDQDSSNPHAQLSETGQLLRDNIYGSLEEDALRRDFTTNSLYYDPSDNSVLDFTGGFSDTHNHLLRIIGDPEQRYREDPVRMLRAVRFAAKLGFSLDNSTAEPIAGLAQQLNHVAPARMFDEVLKTLLSGFGAAAYQLMKEYQLFAPLFPVTCEVFNEDSDRLIAQALINTDARLASGKNITPAFFFSVVLWNPLNKYLEKNMATGLPLMAALHRASSQVIARQMHQISIPRRFSIPMREIWDFQWRLPKRSPKRTERLVEHPRFRAAYDFLLLREECGENTEGLGQWWTDYQNADLSERAKMTKDAQPARTKHRRRSKRN